MWHTSRVACLSVATLLVPSVQTVSAQTGRANDASEQPSAVTSALSADNGGNLFQKVVGDFGALFRSRADILILAGGLGVSGAVSPLDHRVATGRLNTERSDGGALDRFFELGDLTGSWMVQFGVPVSLYAIAHAASRPGAARVGRDLLRAQLVTTGLTQTIKRTVKRMRPDEGATSFPSGHAAASFAAATVLHRHYGWKVGAPAYAGATWVALSRLSEQRHWLSDLPFGASIGIAAGRVATRGLRTQGWSVAPTLLPGGVGVQVSFLPDR